MKIDLPGDEPLDPPLLSSVMQIAENTGRIADELKYFNKLETIDNKLDAVLKNQKVLHDEHLQIIAALKAVLEAVLGPAVRPTGLHFHNKRSE